MKDLHPLGPLLQFRKKRENGEGVTVVTYDAFFNYKSTPEQCSKKAGGEDLLLSETGDGEWQEEMKSGLHAETQQDIAIMN